MGTILPFLRGQPVFDPEMLGAMSAAFDQACQVLRLPETAGRERESVAVKIVELARRGERDPKRLYQSVVRDAGPS